MLVIGAHGFAKELLEVLYQLDWLDDLAFYDDVNTDSPGELYGHFPVLTDITQATNYFKEKDKRFALGVGGPRIRNKLTAKFEQCGGMLTTVVSPKSEIGHFGTTIGAGTVILTGAIITNDVTIGRGVLINKKCMIGHDCKIGDFAELSPGVHLGGHTAVGNCSTLGMGSIVIPGHQIGDDSVVGAGAVVTKDVPPGATVVGVPAKLLSK